MSSITTGHPGDAVESNSTISGAGKAQFFAWSGSKTAWDIGHRGPVTTPDVTADLSSLARLLVGNAPQIVIWGKCASPNQLATVVPVYLDESNNVLFMGDPINLQASTFRETSSGRYVSQGLRATIDAASCSTIALLVTQCSATWDFYIRGY